MATAGGAPSEGPPRAPADTTTAARASLAAAIRGALLLVALAGLLLPLSPALAASTVPVRVRLLKAMREGPALVDVKLADIQPQLGKLAYVRWDALSEHQADMETGKVAVFELPDGATLELTLMEASKDKLTFEVKVSAHKTRSKLTISRDQRIVHQVTDEQGGVAYFCSIRLGS